MSDYLGDLVARSLETTELVQPRLASRFEPAPHGGPLARSPGELTADAVTDGFVEVRAHTKLPARSREQPLVAPAQPGQASETSGAVRLRQDASEATAGSPRRAPEAQRPGLETIATPVEPTKSQTNRFQGTGHQEREQARTQGPSVVSAMVAPAAKPSAVAGLLVTGDALASERGQLAIEDRPLPPVNKTTAEVQPASPDRVLVQPHVAIAPPTRPASTDGFTASKLTPQREPQPAPTIQVTIGRIEVRATPAPAASPASKAKPAPVLSLDDYLRQRNGGSR
jgi:hypothetical protein